MGADNTECCCESSAYVKSLDSKSQADATPPKADRCLCNLCILLIEDSFDNQILFSRMLRGAGARVDIAENGLEGVRKEMEAARGGDGEYDAVVMDIRMPVMDGYQASERIRSRGFQGPIIALTAHAVPGEEVRCRSVGCSHFLTKPVDRSLLIKTIFEACGGIQRSTGK